MAIKKEDRMTHEELVAYVRNLKGMIRTLQAEIASLSKKRGTQAQTLKIDPSKTYVLSAKQMRTCSEGKMNFVAGDKSYRPVVHGQQGETDLVVGFEEI